MLIWLKSSIQCRDCVVRIKFDECAFSHAGPAAWNALPEDIRTNRDRTAFRKQLKTHFFTLAYAPMSIL